VSRATGIRGWLAIGATALAVAAPSVAQLNPKEPPEAIRGMEVTERLGAQIPLDLEFMDWNGQPVKLSKYFATGKPVILVLGYYDCPMVCPLIAERLLESLNQVDYTVGKDFNVVYISFDPDNTTQAAAEFRRHAVDGYQRGRTEEIQAGWAFHTSRPGPMKTLADAVGYEYRYLEESGEYSHPVALAFLSGDGVVSRYIYGFDYDPRDVKLSLMEASKGAIAQSLGDRLLWFCFHYDASTGKYTLAAFRVMQAGGLITVTAVGLLIVGLRAAERARRRRATGAGESMPRGGVAMAGPRA
jgi:protein SCO1/2